MSYTPSYLDELDRKIFPFVEYEGYKNRYPTLNPLRLSYSEIEELKKISKALYAIFQKVVEVFQACPDDFLANMGMPDKLRPYLSLTNDLKLPTFLSRFDYVLTPEGNFKMVEINADTPCAVVESYYGNQVAADYYRERNPNSDALEQLKKFLGDMYYAMGMMRMDSTGNFNHERPFVFACFDDYIEDKATTDFLMNAMREVIKTQWARNYNEKDIVFISFYDLMIDDEGVLLPDGRHAGAIYRLHPLEILIEEFSPEDNFPLGVAFMEAYKAGKFKLFNPPESIIMQCKAFQALVWALHTDTDFFTNSENEIIQQYMIPSYFDEYDFNKNAIPGTAYVKKPIWGREGSGITIVKTADNEKLSEKLNVQIEYEKYVENEDEIVQAESSAYLYQQFINSKKTILTTDSGSTEGYLTLSCFMLGKEASAVYSRFSEDVIAGTEAYWAPILYKKD